MELPTEDNCSTAFENMLNSTNMLHHLLKSEALIGS